VWVCWRHAQQLQTLVDLDPAVKQLSDWYRWCAAKRVHCEADGIETYETPHIAFCIADMRPHLAANIFCMR